MGKRARTRTKFLCLDCGRDTGKMREHYFVHTDTWLSVVGSKSGMLCIKCLEERLGRELNSSDFTDCTINNPKYSDMSELLLRRVSN